MNEGEMVGMLRLAVDLLYNDDDDPTKISSLDSSSQFVSTIERGIELRSVLISNASIKKKKA
jgi:hypothetical protein